MTLRINEPHVIWDSNTLRSASFNDVYFSSHGAISEAQHVYLNSNSIPEKSTSRKTTWIGEIGFGMGINFSLTLSHWRNQPTHHLHYVSIESAPFDREFLVETFQKHFPEMDASWIQLYPRHPTAGIFSLPIYPHVTLHLLLGNAIDVLDEWVYPHDFLGFDAWYLDGFSPNKNESAWDLKLLKKISSLSKKGTTASTYSVAGSVREALKESGFNIEKIPGIGKKKHILKAVLENPVARKSNLDPWLALPTPIQHQPITIWGSGLAGASIARTLAERGWRVTVREPLSEIAAGASGNPAGVFMPHLASETNDTSRFSLHAFQIFLRWFENYGAHSGHASHVREIGLDKDTLSTTKKALREHSLRPGLAHIAQDLSILYSTSGWISPKKWCEHLLTHPLIEVKTNANWVPGGFTLIALGKESMNHLPDLGFQMKGIKGQILSIPESELKSAPWEVLMKDAYSIPYSRDQLIGATFEQKKNDSNVDREILDPFILKALKQLGLELKSGHIKSEWKARASIRAMTPDKLPIVGSVPELNFYRASYQDLYKGKRPSQYPAAQYVTDLMVLAGLGSRGITYACSSAELIADLIEGKPLGMDRDLYSRVHPARFLIRGYKSRKPVK